MKLHPIEAVLGGERNELLPRTSWDDYKDFPGLNPSTIVKAVRGRDDDGELILSLRHLKWAWDHPGYGDNDDLLWGRAVHCLLFETSDFERRYARWEDGRQRRGKDYDAFRLDNWNKEILTAGQWDTALEASQSFIHDIRVQELVALGSFEATVLKVMHGLQCRGRLDWVQTSEAGEPISIVDLKTTKSLEPRAFGYDFFKYHYDIKLGLYRRWLSLLAGRMLPVWVIALEKEPPYEIDVIPVPDAVLDYGAEKGLKIIKRVRQCIEANDWPGIEGGYLYVPHGEMESIELTGAEEVEA